MRKSLRIISLICLILFLLTGTAYAAATDRGIDYLAKYEAVIYGKDDGLLSLESNAIVQTKDAYIWVGTYSGLYRFDGSSFERVLPDSRISSVMDLFVDSRGRMWIGTNDSGLGCFDPVTGETAFYTEEDGLTADSIRAIGEGEDGLIYAGTVDGLSIIDNDGTIRNPDAFSEITGVRSLSGYEDIVCGVTNGGVLFTVKGEELLGTMECDIEGVDYTCVTLRDRHNMLAGTSDTYIDRLYSEGDLPEIAERFDTGDISYFSYIDYDDNNGEFFFCAENGLGVADEKGGNIHPLTREGFESSICDVMKDYQGNVWFVSNKQGILKYSPNPFMDVFIKAGIEKSVVNSIEAVGNELYIGKDDGLSVVDKDSFKLLDKGFEESFDGIRIRNVHSDKEGNIWISSYGPEGLYRISPDGSVTSFNEADGTLGGRFRLSIELSDSRVMAASNTGLSIIEGDRVVKTLGKDEGLETPQILTMVEDEDGSVLAGSDGGGIFTIKDDMVTGHKGKAQGLDTLVVLRIVPYGGGFFYVTSNAIYYDDRESVKKLENFPYSNNYDIFISLDKAWVFSSAGIFIVNADDLKTDTPSGYILLDYTRGFDTSLTANSWNETIDEGSNLLICCTDGVRKIDTHSYDYVDRGCVINVKSVTGDDKEILPEKDGSYTIPPTRGRIQIKAAILNYTLTNPAVHMFLEGTGDEGIYATQSGLPSLEYTNLPYGNYKLHIQMLEGTEGKVFRDEVFRINKKPRLTELIFVRILIALFGALLVGLIVWRILQSTIIRHQYEEIRVAKAEADRANSAKSRFLANMSHEIRTPINTIMGMDEMILREPTDNVPEEYASAVTGYASDIKRASELLLGLINDVLDMSKIESGKMNLVEEDYDTVEFLRSLVSMIRVKSNEKDLTFETDIDPSLPRVLHGDSGRLKQVILNLLTNAVKYTQHGGFTLKVFVEEKQSDSIKLHISVKDTGIGIREEDMHKLFSAFERLDEKKNSGIQGTGLGLDISRQFVSLMGGELKCDSVYGEGSVFYFTVEQGITDPSPIGEFKEGAGKINNGSNLPEFVSEKAKILIVDDNEMNLQVIRGLLKRTKAALTTALSGRECLKKLKEDRFNVVLLDHMMPEMDGIKTLEEIRKNEEFRDLPVIALTANAANSGGEFYREAGFNDYLAKPVDGKLLESTIKKYLPGDILETPESAEFTEEEDELPPDEHWLLDVKGISVSEGIKNCGGAGAFLKSIKTFYDTLPANAEVIEKSYNEGDYELYTVKVHALKSSARIIGASDLSEKARLLEDAGKSGDIDYIRNNTEEALSLYRNYLTILSPLSEGGEGKTAIPEDELEGAYEALRELIPQMDYDGVEMVIEQVKEYSLDKKNREIFSELEKELKALNWEKMGELLL